MFIKDFKWKKGITVKEVVDSYRNLGYQSIELKKASDVIVKMKKDNAKIFLTFTSIFPESTTCCFSVCSSLTCCH